MLQQKLAKIEEFRATSSPLPSGVASYTSSASFKTTKCSSKPKATSWKHRLSLEATDRCDSSLKATSRNDNPAGMISLGTARPSPSYNPWEAMTMHGVDVNSHETVAMSCTKGEQDYDLAVALNYGYAAGSPQLLRFVTEHMELIHDPPYDEWASCLTCSTTSGIEILFRMLCNRGEWILAEEYTYSGTLEGVKPLGLHVQGVKMDEDGLLPDDLEFILQTWDPARGPKPFVLYTIPSGQNPTGITQTIERRKAVYHVAQRHDLCIIEDDPYYLLQLGDDMCHVGMDWPAQKAPAEYVRSLTPSYLSLDVSGRVLRLDTMSKILAPGLRCGWLTGCFELVSKFLNHTEFSTVAPSGPAQVMLHKLLDETWGHLGFIRWLSYLSQEYRQRRDVMIGACIRHLPPEICSWSKPGTGMFLWIRVDSSRHPKGRERLFNVEERIYLRAKSHGVQVSKGSWFATGDNVSVDVRFRLTFAAAPVYCLELAIQRFGDALRAEFMLDDGCSKPR